MALAIFNEVLIFSTDTIKAAPQGRNRQKVLKSRFF
jgi:hypothetical protein